MLSDSMTDEEKPIEIELWGGGAEVGGGGLLHSWLRFRVPTAQGKREYGEKKSLSGKTQGIGKFCQKTWKTQGIWFA